MSDRIHQEVVFQASPVRIYELLTEAKPFSQMTGGAPTEISAVAGGSFSCFGGMISGRNLECIPGQRVVQAWRVKSWEPGLYSIVRFELRPEGTATRVILDHAGFPEAEQQHLAGGWAANYWDPLKKVLS